MSNLRLKISTSLDGFVAGPSQSDINVLGTSLYNYGLQQKRKNSNAELAE